LRNDRCFSAIIVRGTQRLCLFGATSSDCASRLLTILRVVVTLLPAGLVLLLLILVLVVLLLVSGVALAFWFLNHRQTDIEGVSGTIETDQVRVASRYGGRVEKIFADEGDVLTAGQVIIRLEAAELQARREAAAAMLAELEAGPRKEEIAAAKGDWQSLQAEYEFALADDKRTKELFEKNTVSESEREP
jgi:HlyD family secretion protein